MRRLLTLLAFTLAASAYAQTQVALTFDDLPAHSSLPPDTTRLAIAQTLIAGLKKARTPPIYGFVNAVHLSTEPATAEVLQAWRDAGFPLGNHTWSHMDLNQHTAEEWEAEVTRNEATLQHFWQRQEEAAMDGLEVHGERAERRGERHMQADFAAAA